MNQPAAPAWVYPLSPDTDQPPEVIGAKAHGLIELRRLGLAVPPGFVITTAACRAYLRDGCLPDGLSRELRRAVNELEAATGRRFGGPRRPLVVSVRSGAGTSMPSMMNTILDLGLTTATTDALAVETGDPQFAADCRSRFLVSYATTVAGIPPQTLARIRSGAAAVERIIEERTGERVPDHAEQQLVRAIAAVFASWDTPRARTYRDLNDLPNDHGTAVTVQAMVFGNRDARSGTGVAFSRNPNTGEPTPYGDVLFTRQGDDVVGGGSVTRPLGALADAEPTVWGGLLDAMRRIERHCRDACYVEFTFEAGELWLLQVRPGRFVGRAAVRAAVDLIDEGLLSPAEALHRVSARDLDDTSTQRIVSPGGDLLTTGIGASPGIAVGRIALSADTAVTMARHSRVVLVRPETSPLDIHGIAAAAGIVTTTGGTASHAAVIARAMGKPAIVGATGIAFESSAGHLVVGPHIIAEGTAVTIDGTSGHVIRGAAETTTDGIDAYARRLRVLTKLARS